MISVGDRVEIVCENRTKNSRIGQTAKVIRKGVGKMYWLEFDSGNELVWKGKWLKKMEEKNGSSI